MAGSVQWFIARLCTINPPPHHQHPFCNKSYLSTGSLVVKDIFKCQWVLMREKHLQSQDGYILPPVSFFAWFDISWHEPAGEAENTGILWQCYTFSFHSVKNSHEKTDLSTGFTQSNVAMLERIIIFLFPHCVCVTLLLCSPSSGHLLLWCLFGAVFNSFKSQNEVQTFNFSFD